MFQRRSYNHIYPFEFPVKRQWVGAEVEGSARPAMGQKQLESYSALDVTKWEQDAGTTLWLYYSKSAAPVRQCLPHSSPHACARL